MHTALALLGVGLILLVHLEAFESLVLPRQVLRSFRFTRTYYRTSWRIWLGAVHHVPGLRRQYTLLSFFGPLSLLVLFVIWATALIVGFGFIHFAVDGRGGDLADALYLSGTTFTTLGYGDLTPGTPAGRVLSVAESATGLGYFAVVIGYLPVLYQAFGRREAFIALLDARAGSPPAAARIFLRTPPVGDAGDCLDSFLGQAERWAAEILESHLSYPVLGYYRSQHDNQSWLSALACALDTTALLLTVVEGSSRTQARLTFALARHAAVDLGLVVRRPPVEPAEDRLPPQRLTELLAKLKEAGLTVRDDREARAKLIQLRKLYEPFVEGLAQFFRLTVPCVWPTEERPDNWRTSAYLRHAGPLTSLGVDSGDDHFE